LQVWLGGGESGESVESPKEERELVLLGARPSWEESRACGWLRSKERKKEWAVKAKSKEMETG
jgi:hypothetical protein